MHKACYRNGNILRCSQSRSIQDYKPRHFAFSFGFYCEHKSSKSLKGLWYNVTVYSQTNETVCSTMPGNVPYCSKFYNQVSHLNLIDHKNREDAAKLFRSLFHTEWILGDVFDCYPYFLEAACYLFFPRCNTTSNSLTVPCRESWKQLGEACLESSNDLDNVVVTLFSLKAKETVAAYDSEYLPSRFGPVNCYYEDVFCGSAPNVTGAEIYWNSTVRCLYSGKWPKPPVCRDTPSSNNLLKILPPTLILLALCFLAVVTSLFSQKMKESCYKYNLQKAERI